MEEKMLMTPGAYVLASVILFIIGFVGFFANLIVIVMMCRDQRLWTPLNYILFNLIISDFTVSILGNPFTLSSAIAMQWIFGHAMCIAYGFFMALLGIGSISTLTVLALERYLMVSRPLNRCALSSRAAISLVGGIWIYAGFVTVPPLLGWGEYGPEAANLSCSVNWETRGHNSTSYIIYLFVLGFFIPLFVICFSYINIIRTMKKSSLAMGGVSKAESRVVLMIAVMILAFLIAWTPYAIFALIVAFLDLEVSPALATVPAVFAKTSICYNPFIYVGLNTQFKQSWKKLLCMRSTEEFSMERATTGVSALSPSKYRLGDVTQTKYTRASVSDKNNGETNI
ncbi:pinopsin-like [Cimex lectularius]|uniref:G-protein coupled receptors family 1 profile domain-containing protein n=1 Tax=Cimex lectularius TaxID=79782 RepID=A0A8I6RR06_CIMLE|nr:pinopsin-like [Cimex lectularius]